MKKVEFYTKVFSRLTWCVSVAVLLTVAAGCEKGTDEPGNEMPDLPEISDKDFFLRSVCVKDVNGKYTLKFGVADEKDPSVYHMKAESPESCFDFFNSLIKGTDSDHSDPADDFSYTFSDGDRISYSYSEDGISAGRISFEITELPYISEIEFIPADNWPYNSAENAYEFGKIYEIQDEKYICVKESFGDYGILLGVESIPWEEVNRDRYLLDRPEDGFYVEYLLSLEKYANYIFNDFVDKIYIDKAWLYMDDPYLFAYVLVYREAYYERNGPNSYFAVYDYFNPYNYGPRTGRTTETTEHLRIFFSLKFLEFGPEEIMR